MREHAQVVIIGAGIVGCSAAYHLTRKGLTDVVVLEQGPLFATGGSTSHAPGLMFQLNASRMVTALAAYSRQLYKDVVAEGEPGFHEVGSVEVATTPERWEDLKRKEGLARSWGLTARLIDPDEAVRLSPLLDADQLYGALHVPSDGIAKAVRVAQHLGEAAMARGAAFYGHTRVTGIEVAGGRVRAVVTAAGRVWAEQVLVCAGIWGPLVGRMAGVPIPLSPMQHQYAMTAPLPALAGQTSEIAQPLVRHQDRSMYLRQHGECYGIGSYRHEPLLVDAERIPRHEESDMPSVLPFTEDDFAPALRDAVALMPALRGAALPYRINGMFSFTPDGHSLLGESLEVRGFWVAEAVWVTHGGGVGRVMAEWMVDGAPDMDLHEADLNRFHAHAVSRPYVQARAAQQYREVYDIIHPLQQIERPRNLRLSPFHRRLEELGATFVESAGWERPHWFAANERELTDHEQGQEQEQERGWSLRVGWAARHWSPVSGVEHRATRERVAMFDLTPFTKLEVAGPGALAYLQRLASNNMDGPTGKVTYTAMLDERGGIQCDLTVTRLSETRFWVVTGGSVGMHDLAWMRRHAPDDGSVGITDLTSAYCCIGLWGPRARDVARQVGVGDLSNEAFPYFTARRATIGHVPALLVRVSYAGELGWEVYAPTEYGLALWDTLWEAGQPFGVTAAGGGAFDSLRVEKGYRLWGVDIDPDHNPLEAGLGFAVRLKKGDFLGREALLSLKERGLARKLCCLTFDDPCAVALGKEPILEGERTLGYVTSAAHGYTVGRGIAYGYLPVECAVEGTRVEVQYFGRRYPATVAREPLYDAKGMRLRS